MRTFACCECACVCVRTYSMYVSEFSTHSHTCVFMYVQVWVRRVLQSPAFTCICFSSQYVTFHRRALQFDCYCFPLPRGKEGGRERGRKGEGEGKEGRTQKTLHAHYTHDTLLHMITFKSSQPAHSKSLSLPRPILSLLALIGEGTG